MARGNMLLGFARGSVGDVTFRRVRGQQISTARNRNPRNPQSNAQTIARLSFASAQKLTQALSVVVSNSFQSLEYGQPSSNYFLSGAAKAIGALTRKAYSGTPTQSPFGLAPIVPYDSSLAVAVSTRVSEGTLSPGFIVAGRFGPSMGIVSSKALYAGNITVANLQSSLGLSLDTQLTIIVGEVVAQDYDLPTVVNGVKYHIGRLNFKQDLPDETVLFSYASEIHRLSADAVDTSRSSISAMSISTADDNIVSVTFADGFTLQTPSAAAAAVIYSQYSAGTWLRSTTDLVVPPLSTVPTALELQEKLGYNDVLELLDYSRTSAAKSEETFLNQEPT